MALGASVFSPSFQKKPKPHGHVPVGSRKKREERRKKREISVIVLTLIRIPDFLGK